MEYLKYVYAVVRLIIWCAEPASHNDFAALDEFFKYDAPYGK